MPTRKPKRPPLSEDRNLLDLYERGRTIALNSMIQRDGHLRLRSLLLGVAYGMAESRETPVPDCADIVRRAADENWAAAAAAEIVNEMIAEAELKCLVETHRKNAPELAAWLEVAIPEGLAVFTLPEHHRKRMRTSNPIERAVQQELKRRTVKVRVFPNRASLLRLVTAVLVEIDETWQASTQPYINWNTPDA